MRKLVFVAALAGTALSLSACGESAEVEAPVEEDVSVDLPETTEMTGVIDASTATVEELSAVESISPELADAIVASQPYADVTALNTVLLENVSEDEAGIILERVFVPVNLNDASEEAIALIPGMTGKMIHEFEEYRPYADMDEFDREIGKYVDAEEVARFRNYVTL
ncbi:helix-hairpin-helix domain-containing protein [Aurantiacibacter rhizosphaerae]|uniref:Helix-hairpin-helix domain-containing protein n=1 Tax=Aurantiacibacter rhizosphaerae TaxID=2691582 RepID=A0A844X7R8_9SPHN|nr:helix-hairpin-helix domain-containing protein [Aurantiacibacter rhizosphaerae]MWV26411.1 hypothetical protein [Aurantiacibacter rhizosphaerae]